MNTKQLFAAACVLASASRVFAGTITFDNAPVTGQDLGGFYQGVTFGEGAQVTAGNTVLPAHSGTQVLYTGDLLNPTITATFATVQSDVSFWYVTEFGLVANAYDKNGNLLKSIPEAGTVNLGTLTGTDAFLDFGVSGIASITITDDAGLGNFLNIDDLTAPGVSGLPAPDATSTFALLGVAGLGLLAFRRKFVAQ